MCGDNKELENSSFHRIFALQQQFQKEVTNISILPQDNLEWFVYHMNAMQEELGEVLKADKRWKTHRNTNYDPANKLEELADVFITAINLSMFSGFDVEQILSAIVNKISENNKKFEKIRKE